MIFVIALWVLVSIITTQMTECTGFHRTCGNKGGDNVFFSNKCLSALLNYFDVNFVLSVRFFPRLLFLHIIYQQNCWHVRISSSYSWRVDDHQHHYNNHNFHDQTPIETSERAPVKLRLVLVVYFYWFSFSLDTVHSMHPKISHALVAGFEYWTGENVFGRVCSLVRLVEGRQVVRRGCWGRGSWSARRRSGRASSTCPPQLFAHCSGPCQWESVSSEVLKSTWGSRWGRRREGECRLAPL